MTCLHLQSDGEYGTYVFYKHYNDKVLSYFTEYEDLQEIIKELEEKIATL